MLLDCVQDKVFERASEDEVRRYEWSKVVIDVAQTGNILKIKLHEVIYLPLQRILTERNDSDWLI